MGEHHGVRRTYQRGCRCDRCTAANLAYMAAYRHARRARRPVLGTHVDGKEAAQILERLIDEGYTKGDIARALGHEWPVLHWKRGARVTLRTTLALRVLLRRVEQTGVIA